MTNNKFQMIMCIVNEGFSEEVMEAARDAGATGGTIMHAHGTANAEAVQKFKMNITIQPHKDVVMIIVPEEISDAVLKAVNEKAGIHTNGNGIAFALPVDKTAGITKYE